MLELFLCFGAGVATSMWLRRRSGRRAKSLDQEQTFSPRDVGAALSGSQCAGILFMSLTPSVSALIFHELTSEMFAQLTSEISKLPKITSETRLHVVEKFCQSLGIPESHESFEEAAKAEPRLVAKAISILASPPSRSSI